MMVVYEVMVGNSHGTHSGGLYRDLESAENGAYKAMDLLEACDSAQSPWSRKLGSNEWTSKPLTFCTRKVWIKEREVL